MDPDGPWSSFEPHGVGEGPDAPAPSAVIDPNIDHGWLRRMWPLLAARRFRFFGALLGAR